MLYFSVAATQRRPTGAPAMTYGRSIFKSLDKFGIDTDRWHELAANRTARRETLRTGLAPVEFRPRPPSASPPPPPPVPLAKSKPTRVCAQATNAAIDATLRVERQPFGDTIDTI